MLDDPEPPVTAADLRARVEAQFSYKLLVAWRLLIGRPLRRYPPPSWTPHIVAACVLAGVVFVAALAWLFR